MELIRVESDEERQAVIDEYEKRLFDLEEVKDNLYDELKDEKDLEINELKE